MSPLQVSGTRAAVATYELVALNLIHFTTSTYKPETPARKSINRGTPVPTDGASMKGWIPEKKLDPQSISPRKVKHIWAKRHA
ncbi:hypothetical protein WAI453_007421 [Rhynchosporium graminicola]